MNTNKKIIMLCVCIGCFIILSMIQLWKESNYIKERLSRIVQLEKMEGNVESVSVVVLENEVKK